MAILFGPVCCRKPIIVSDIWINTYIFKTIIYLDYLRADSVTYHLLVIVCTCLRSLPWLQYVSKWNQLCSSMWGLHHMRRIRESHPTYLGRRLDALGYSNQSLHFQRCSDLHRSLIEFQSLFYFGHLQRHGVEFIRWYF